MYFTTMYVYVYHASCIYVGTTIGWRSQFHLILRRHRAFHKVNSILLWSTFLETNIRDIIYSTTEIANENPNRFRNVKNGVEQELLRTPCLYIGSLRSVARSSCEILPSSRPEGEKKCGKTCLHPPPPPFCCGGR
jgi:hypothetical protein